MSTLDKGNAPRGTVRKRELRAFSAGMQAATRKALPALEERYRLATAYRFWTALIVVGAIAFAAGTAVGYGWPL